MFYAFKVNNALIQLGVNPNKMNADYRRMSQQTAKALGYTAREAAVLITSQIPLQNNPGANIANLDTWIENGDVRMNIHEIALAVTHIMKDFRDLSSN